MKSTATEDQVQPSAEEIRLGLHINHYMCALEAIARLPDDYVIFQQCQSMSKQAVEIAARALRTAPRKKE